VQLSEEPNSLIDLVTICSEIFAKACSVFPCFSIDSLISWQIYSFFQTSQIPSHAKTKKDNSFLSEISNFVLVITGQTVTACLSGGNNCSFLSFDFL